MLKKARGRHDIMLAGDRYEVETSKLARIATDDKLFNTEFEQVEDVRRSLQVSTIKNERKNDRNKKNSPLQSNSITDLAAAMQSYGTHQAKDKVEAGKFDTNIVPTLRSSFQVQRQNN